MSDARLANHQWEIEQIVETAERGGLRSDVTFRCALCDETHKTQWWFAGDTKRRFGHSSNFCPAGYPAWGDRGV